MSLPSHPLPTPECIDVSSVTPDSIKSPTPPTVAESRPATEANPEATATATEDDRSGSPPPSCPICLGKYKNKCFTDSCLHQFCFNCLLEWSKIKAECPLCKQSFKSIIHNVKSEREFEEYLVQQPLHYNVMLSEPFRYSVSTTLQVRPSQNETLQRLFLHHPSLTDRYIFPRNDRPMVRRRIYERGLYALPLFDITGRARECSAEFYRNNQAQIHRLIPFLNREAIHVIQDQRLVTSLMQRANEILTTHDITSPEFRRQMEPYFRENTVHFIHEFYNFARSPYDMYGYDNNVQYSQDYNLALQSTTDNYGSNSERDRGRGGGSGSGNGSSGAAAVAGSSRNIAGNLGRSAVSSAASSSNPWPINLTNYPVVNVLSSSSSSSSEDESHQGPSTSSATTPATASGIVRRENVSVIQTTNPVNLSTASSTPSSSTTTTINSALPTSSAAIKTEQQRVESVIRTAGEPSVKIELSDSDSDECQFVLERKPPHLRTPEYVSLNSDEDSDVVFVDQSTDKPVLPVKEPPRHGRQNQQQPPNLLDDSSHLPIFMPYMVGMDVVEAGPSTSTATAVGTALGVVAGGMEGRPSSSSNGGGTVVGEGTKLKHEDPMLSLGSSSAQKRSRQSLRRQSGHPKFVWSSSEDDDEEERGMNESLAKHLNDTLNSSRSRRTTQPTNYADDSESSEDEYLAMRLLKMSPKKKKESPPSKARRKGKNATVGGRATRRKAAAAQNAKRQKRAESSGPCRRVGDEEDEEDANQQKQQEKLTQMAMAKVSQERQSDSSSASGPEEEEEEEGDGASYRMDTQSELQQQHQAPSIAQECLPEMSHQQPQPSSQMEVSQQQEEQHQQSETTTATSSDEDNDSNQGSVATSESAGGEGTSDGGSGSGGSSESEEIDVQNDDFFNN